MTLTKQPIEYTSAERRAVYSSLCKQHLAGMTPTNYGRFSAQQVAYAKGRATVAMRRAGF